MNHSPRMTVFLVLLAGLLSGCSGSGRFSRGQYTSMSADPFLSEDSDTEYETAVADSTDDSSTDKDESALSRTVAAMQHPVHRDVADDGAAATDMATDATSSASDFLANVDRAVSEQATDAQQTASEFMQLLDQQTDEHIQQASSQAQAHAKGTVTHADHVVDEAVFSRFPDASSRQPPVRTADLSRTIDQSATDTTTDFEAILADLQQPAAPTTPAAEENPFAELDDPSPFDEMDSFSSESDGPVISPRRTYAPPSGFQFPEK